MLSLVSQTKRTLVIQISVSLTRISSRLPLFLSINSGLQFVQLCCFIKQRILSSVRSRLCSHNSKRGFRSASTRSLKWYILKVVCSIELILQVGAIPFLGVSVQFLSTSTPDNWKVLVMQTLSCLKWQRKLLSILKPKTQFLSCCMLLCLWLLQQNLDFTIW